MTFYVLMCC